MAMHGDESHATLPPASQKLSVHVSEINHNLLSTSPFLKMQTPITSVAARKAALLEKLGGGNSNGSTPSPSAAKPWTSPGFSQPDWTKLVTERRERKDTLASTISSPSVPPKLSPMPTGSTVASTVVDPFGTTACGLGAPVEAVLPRLSSSGATSRVRLAVMALNSMDKSVQKTPTWRVGGGAGGDGSRPWSRMSGATKFGDAEMNWAAEKAFKEEDEQEEQAEDQPPLGSSVDPTPSPLLSINLSLEAPEPPVSAGNNTEPFDTHPPDMVSPRTGLAYVMLPPWARRRSSVDMEAAGLSSRKVFPTLDNNQKEVAREISSVVGAPRPDSAAKIEKTEEPRRSPSPTPTLPPVRRNAPIVLRGTTRLRPRPSVNHGRTVSMHRGPQSPASPIHGRSTSMSKSHPPSSFPSAGTRRHSVQPTQFWEAPERLRRSSFCLPTIPDEPLVVKAQNKVPLRKVQTNAPRPMRFSLAN